MGDSKIAAPQQVPQDALVLQGCVREGEEALVLCGQLGFSFSQHLK